MTRSAAAGTAPKPRSRPANVERLKLLWNSQLPTPPQDTALSTLTSPLVAQVDGKTLVFTIGIDDTLFALDADSGKIVWQKSFPNTAKPVRAPQHQLRQHRAGHARDRQEEGRDLLHHQRRQAAGRRPRRRRREN